MTEQLSIEGLSRSDALDLLDLLPPGAAQERDEPLPPGELGEPATVMVLLALSFTALTALSGWLASRGKDVELSIGLQAPGVSGTVSFKARSGDSARDLEARVRQQGVAVPGN
jgi:hypothetical protein